jgi:hypothetical protein
MLHLKIQPIRDRLVELSEQFAGFADLGLGEPVDVDAALPEIARRSRL